MNEIFERLIQAASKLDLQGNSNIARFLNESPQVVTNWSKRGVPARKIIEIAPLLGVSPEWLQTGKGAINNEASPINISALINVATPTYLNTLQQIQKAQDAGVLEESDKAMLKIIADKYKDRL